ncbi:MAG: phytoene/squalene synthase family protein [Limisphaerales bacterium]
MTSLLREVSRSFYLTMRMLPPAIRSQISVAYLLARTTDTIADIELASVELRLAALAALRAAIHGEGKAPLDFTLPPGQGLPGERVLLERRAETLELLRRLEESDRRRVREVLDIIISGQELDLTRFGAATAKQIAALETDGELDDYTYRVAGCVGEFWTKMCRAHCLTGGEPDDGGLERQGVRFGKGLQLINILRDLPRDLRNGRCYVPRQALAAVDLTPSDLLSPEKEPRFRPLYDTYLALASSHLAAGWEYTERLPRRQFRLRLACAWPLLIGARTVRKLRQENILDATRRVKITRAEVRSVVLRSVFLYPFPARWRAQLAQDSAP